MDCFSANSKIFRLHAVLHDAAGSVKSTTYKAPGYCNVLLEFRVLVFLITWLDCSSVYMLKFLLHQYMHYSIVSHFNQKLQRKQLTS